MDKCMGVVKTNIYKGDCLYILNDLPDNSFDLIFTSPPYADSRSKTYGGIRPDESISNTIKTYVE